MKHGIYITVVHNRQGC